MSSSPFFSEHLAACILSSKHRLNIASPMPPTRYFCSHSSRARRLISAQRSCEAKARGAWMATSNTRPLNPNLILLMQSRNCPDNLPDTESDTELQPGSCRELHEATTEPKPPAGRGAAWAGSAGTRTAAANCFGDRGRGKILQHLEKTW